jgi:hypothetical protein
MPHAIAMKHSPPPLADAAPHFSQWHEPRNTAGNLGNLQNLGSKMRPSTSHATPKIIIIILVASPARTAFPASIHHSSFSLHHFPSLPVALDTASGFRYLPAPHRTVSPSKVFSC